MAPDAAGGDRSRMQKFLREPVGARKEFPDSVKRAGPYLIAGSSLVVGLLWYVIAPIPNILSWAYWVSAVVWFFVMWWWLAADRIPGKVGKTNCGQSRWLVLLGGFAGLLIVGSALGRLDDVAAALPWTFFAGAAKYTWLGLTAFRLRYCPTCQNTRQSLRFGDFWYCSVCGKRLAEANVSEVAKMS